MQINLNNDTLIVVAGICSPFGKKTPYYARGPGSEILTNVKDSHEIPKRILTLYLKELRNIRSHLMHSAEHYTIPPYEKKRSAVESMKFVTEFVTEKVINFMIILKTF